MTNILRSFDNLDNNFINSYKKKTGFWYTFKRSVNDLENLFIIFRYFESYEGKNWFKRQEELSNTLIRAKLLNPSREKINASANARGLKKVFELLGFCFVVNSRGQSLFVCYSVTPRRRRSFFYYVTMLPPPPENPNL